MWFVDEIPFHPPHHFSDNEAVWSALEGQLVRVDKQESNYVTATKSTFADIEQVCRAQVHLVDSQNLELLQVLRAHDKFFDGSLR